MYQQQKLVKLNRLVAEAVGGDKCPKHEYRIIRGKYSDSKQTIGSFLLIKPPKFLYDFKMYLLKNYYYEIYNYLEFNSRALDFPTDGSFKESYEPRLIQAFYLLGKYIGRF